MKKTTLILFILFAASSYCQSGLSDRQYSQSGASKIFSAQTPQEAENLAKADIKAKTPILFIQGGIASVKYPTDDHFKKSYGVYYHDFGCVGIDPKISSAYNKVVFEYLSTAYGKKWLTTIRKDVIGLKDYKKKNGS